MNVGSILVIPFLQSILILRGTLISDRPQTLFTMDPDIWGHTIWDSLEILHALNIENNRIGDPLSLIKCKALSDIITTHQFNGVLQGNFATCCPLINMHTAHNLFDWTKAKKMNPYIKLRPNLYIFDVYTTLPTPFTLHEGVMCIQNFKMLWRVF
jgi:hypothetical protein